MGVASFVIAGLNFTAFVLFVAVGVAVLETAPRADEPGTPFARVSDAWFLGIIFLSLIGMVMGIGGLRQRRRRTQLAVIGLSANVFIGMGLLLLTVIALIFRPPSESAAALQVARSDWHSPAAVISRAMFYFMAMFVCLYYVRKLKRHRTTVAHGTACPNCQKDLPPTAAFCRRCGHVVTSVA